MHGDNQCQIRLLGALRHNFVRAPSFQCKPMAHSVPIPHRYFLQDCNLPTRPVSLARTVTGIRAFLCAADLSCEDILRDMGIRRILSRRPLGEFSKIFLGVAKSGEICFFPLETKKTTCFAKIFKIQGGKPPLLRFRRPCFEVHSSYQSTHSLKIFHHEIQQFVYNQTVKFNFCRQKAEPRSHHFFTI